MKHTRSEYINYIINEQKRELNSDRYRFVKTFVDRYLKRHFLEKEDQLFTMERKYKDIKNQHMTKEEVLADRMKLYNGLENFIKTLTSIELRNNLYLRLAYFVFDTCEVECINLLQNIKVNEIVETSIPKDRGYLLQKQIQTQKNFVFFSADEFDSKSFNILDDKNIHYYQLYNFVIKNFRNIYEFIYSLKLTHILENNNQDIFLEYFYARLNDGEKVYSLRLTKNKD